MKSSIAKSAMGVTIVMVFGYLLSFAKEAVIAGYYGVSSDVDAYTIAIQIPVLLFSFVSVAIRSVVIPIYSDILYKKDEESANDYLSRLLFMVAAISIVIILLCEIFSSGLIYIFAPGFNEQTHIQSTKLLQITLPAILFTVVQQVMVAVLNVHKKFVLPSFTVYLLNIGIICSIVILHSKYGITAACVGQLIGEIASFLFVLVIARKVYRFRLRLSILDSDIMKTLKMTIPVLWSISVAEVNAAVNRMVGSFLFVGSIAALSYASKINTILMSFFVSAITTVVYPLLAESSAKEDSRQLNNRINLTLTVFSLFVIPLMCGIFLYKREIVTLLFQRGNFNMEAVDITQSLLGCYSIGLLFMAFRNTVTNVFYSLKDTKTPAVNATWGAVINIILNLLLPYFIGVHGLALATSVTAIFITTRLLYDLVHKYPEMNLVDLFNNSKGIIISSAIMLILLRIFKEFIEIQSPLLSLFIGASIGVAVYFIGLFICRVPIVEMLFNRIKNERSKISHKR